MTDQERGWYDKFRVHRTDRTDCGGGKHDGCEYFVLDLTHDLHALPAILAYAESCEKEYPLLASDLRQRAKRTRSVRRAAPNLLAALDTIANKVCEMADQGASAGEIKTAVLSRTSFAIARVDRF